MKKKSTRWHFELEVFLTDDENTNPVFPLKIARKYFAKTDRALQRKFVHEIIAAVKLNVNKAPSLSITELNPEELYQVSGNGEVLGIVRRVRKDG